MRVKKIWRLLAPLVLTCCLLSLVPARALAWGPEGHSVVARIAAKQLLKDGNANALRQSLSNLLKQDSFFKVNCKNKNSLEDQLACVASWADAVRDARPETAEWHFVDIPRNQTSYKPARDCKNGDCVIEAIKRFEAVLADKNKSATQRAEALKFIIHFVGDMHQPLHDADDGDLGGNNKLVNFFNESNPGCNNLHKVWDGEIIRKGNASDVNLAKALFNALNPAMISEFMQGDLVAWAEEAHTLARDDAYGLLPQPDAGTLCKITVNKQSVCLASSSASCNNKPKLFRYALGQSYYDFNKGVVEKQLKRGGIRLAMVLKRAL
jgi:hypothetical protein